jgi:hypothetical protein
MVDERNLTQFICILLSQQVTVLPSKDENIEILQESSKSEQPKSFEPLNGLHEAD